MTEGRKDWRKERGEKGGKERGEMLGMRKGGVEEGRVEGKGGNEEWREGK